MLSDLLVLDIETVPVTEEFSQLDSNWQDLWLQKVGKTLPENTTPEESWLQKGGILSEFGKIVCISTAYLLYDDKKGFELRVKSMYGDDEKLLLQSFLEVCNKMYAHNKNFQFAGHNIKEFDIPYICRRLLINQLPLPPYLQLHDKKPWEVKMFDTMSWWKFGDNKNFTSLNLLANVLGVPTSKTDIDGSMVQAVYYKEKNLQRIVEYCQRDVVTTTNIILRFHNLPLLNEENVKIV